MSSSRLIDEFIVDVKVEIDDDDILGADLCGKSESRTCVSTLRWHLIKEARESKTAGKAMAERTSGREQRTHARCHTR